MKLKLGVNFRGLKWPFNFFWGLTLPFNYLRGVLQKGRISLLRY